MLSSPSLTSNGHLHKLSFMLSSIMKVYVLCGTSNLLLFKGSTSVSTYRAGIILLQLWWTRPLHWARLRSPGKHMVLKFRSFFLLCTPLERCAWIRYGFAKIQSNVLARLTLDSCFEGLHHVAAPPLLPVPSPICVRTVCRRAGIMFPALVASVKWHA